MSKTRKIKFAVIFVFALCLMAYLFSLALILSSQVDREALEAGTIYSMLITCLIGFFLGVGFSWIFYQLHIMKQDLKNPKAKRKWFSFTKLNTKSK